MYGRAHKLFATGIACFFSFLFNIPIFTTIILCIFSFLLGTLPDIDQHVKWVKHRTFTHSPSFIMLITLVTTIILYYLFFLVDSLVGFSLFGTDMILYGTVPIPSILHLLITFNVVGLFFNIFTRMFIVLLVAGLSHILLDMITPSGIVIADKKIAGGFVSSSKEMNAIFASLGIITLAFSFTGIFLIHFTLPAYIFEFVFFYGVVFVSSIVIIYVVAFYVLYRRRRLEFYDRFQCYKIRDDITGDYSEICTWKTAKRDNCFGYKGKKICNITSRD